MPPKVAAAPKRTVAKKAPVAAKKKAPKVACATWQRTKSKVMMPDGKKKTLYKHSETGETRVRKMVTRGGKKVTIYIKAPSMRGGRELVRISTSITETNAGNVFALNCEVVSYFKKVMVNRVLTEDEKIDLEGLLITAVSESDRDDVVELFAFNMQDSAQ